MTESLAILGCGPSSGKTILTVGICRSLSDRDVAVAPFKAVSVVLGEPGRAEQAPSASNVAAKHLLAASRVQAASDVAPVVFLARDGTLGEVAIFGSNEGAARLVNEDQVHIDDPRLRGRARLAVRVALHRLRGSHTIVIAEGAGAPTDALPRDDLANIGTSRLLGGPILLTARLSRGGAAAAIVGTMTCLPPDIRGAVVGYVLTDVMDERDAARAARRVQRHVRCEYLGAVPHLPFWDGPPTTHPSDEEAYDIWAETVRRHINLSAARLPALLGMRE